MSDTGELESLRQEVRTLRQRVAELQRRAAQHQETHSKQTASDPGLSAEERLEMLREVERIARTGSWVWNLESNAVFWSEQLYWILGYDPAVETATTERFFERIHPDDRDRVRAVTGEALEKRIGRQVDCRVLRPDGSVRHVSMDGTMLFDSAQRLRRMVGTVLDATEVRESQRRLEEANRQLEEAQSIARMGSWSLDVTSGEWTWSPEVFRILGIAESERPSFELFLAYMHPEDRERLRVEHTQAVAARVDGDFHGRIVRGDGEVRYIEVRGTAVRGPQGAPIRRGVLIDVTERTQLLQRLSRSEKLEAIGRLAGGIAHDFNNLLMVMRGSVELLEGAPDDVLTLLEQSIESAADLTRRLLAFGRQSPMQSRPFQLNDVVLNTLGLVQRVFGARVRVETALSPSLPLGHLDPNLTGQALMNLLLNARDAMPDGGTIRVSTRRVQDDARGSVEVAIQDSGCGVSDELRARVFEPFFTTKATGTGLGLSMVYGAIHQQGGSVSLESPAEGGARFVVRLPISLEAPSDGSEGPGSGGGSVADQLTVLIVEDQVAVAAVIRRTLERDGWEVHVADRPSNALRVFDEIQGRLNVIVCDLVMPEMSGPALIAELERRGAVPAVLFISGYGADAARDVGPQYPLLTKPFTSIQLKDAVRRALEATGGR